MTKILMTTWDGAGTTPPLMSVASALVNRGHEVRVLADPVLRPDVEATDAEHLSWSSAPHRTSPALDSHFVRDWEAGPGGFALMRDNLAVGPAAAFAADVREELNRSRPDVLLTELLLFGPQVAAEAAGVPYVVLNPTVNVIPAPGVPPFGQGFMPAETDTDRERDRIAGELGMQAWDEALPALNAARTEQGLEPLDHVLEQGRSAALTLVMTSSAFDFVGELPPTVKYVGPRVDDPVWAEPWSAPPGDEPLVLVALSSDFQDQGDLLNRIAAALGRMPVRAVVTTGKGIDPADVPDAPGVGGGPEGSSRREGGSIPPMSRMRPASKWFAPPRTRRCFARPISWLPTVATGSRSSRWRRACPWSACPWVATSSTSPRGWS